MKAFVVESGELQLRRDLPAPEPGPGQVQVRVRAVGLNRVDLMRRASHFGAAGGVSIAGLEFAGEVSAVGAGVTRHAVGDRVMAMDASAYAEVACVDERLAVRLPEGLDWHAGAAIPVAFLTAHDALCTNGRFAAGQAVLVAGCTSGVGLAATQLARHLRAGVVAGTSTSPDKLAQMADWGVDIAHAVDAGPVAPALQQATQGRGADVIVDMVGAQAAGDLLAAAAIGARWISVGRVGGKDATIDLAEFARKRLALIGVTFRTRSPDDRARIVADFEAEVLPALRSGTLRPKVDRVFDFDEAPAAQAWLASGKAFGKVVLHLA